MPKQVRREVDLRSVPWLTVQEYAEALGLCDNVVYDAVKTGTIPAIKVSRSLRIPASYLRAQLGWPEPRVSKIGGGQ